jgi:hypothetical protein
MVTLSVSLPICINYAWRYSPGKPASEQPGA